MNIEVEHDSSMRAVHLWIYGKTKAGEEGIVPPLAFVLEPVVMGERSAPSLTLPYRDAHDLFRALAEVLAKERIETPSEATLKGTLEAQRYHLEDLRKMLHLQEPLA